jgi:hypothetical protein
MKRNKFKHKYLRYFIRTNNIKENYIKRGIYGAIFNHPKKIKRCLNNLNSNKTDFYLNIFFKLAKQFNSKEVINYINSI